MTRAADDSTGSQQRIVTVDLIGLPLAIAHRSNEHHATLTRELAFVQAASDPATTPAQLLSLSSRLAQKYASVGKLQRDRATAAAAAGGRTVDLRYEVPDEIADEAEALLRLYEEVDEFCRSGDLVSLVMPADVLAFRRWVSSQFCTQIRAGAPPTPWEGLASAASEATPVASRRTGRITVDEDLDLGGAARLRNAVARELELGVTVLEIDMRNCRFVDSTGISMLLTTRARVRESCGALVLVDVPDAIMRTLRYAGVDDMLADT